MRRNADKPIIDVSYFITKLEILKGYMALKIDGIMGDTSFEDWEAYYWFWFNDKNIREYKHQ
jgi:hypothetical protein